MATGRPEILRLTADPLTAEILPGVGGGVARFDVATGAAVTNIFRPWPEAGTADPNKLGLYVLAPWSNRISKGGFWFGGSFHALAPNLEGEPFPIHGDAWQRPWLVVGHDESSLRLARQSDGPGPFHYRAQLDYRLTATGLSLRMALVNTGERPLPFGAGFHPWLPRTSGTRLQAPARTVWLEDAQHLPTTEIAVQDRPDWDFTAPRALPGTPIDNAFTGWNRQATVFWHDRALALDIEARAPIGNYIVYSPSADAPFFCFEPVTHTVDAHNLGPNPGAHGLIVLASGESLTIECQFGVKIMPTSGA